MPSQNKTFSTTSVMHIATRSRRPPPLQIPFSRPGPFLVQADGEEKPKINNQPKQIAFICLLPQETRALNRLSSCLKIPSLIQNHHFRSRPDDSCWETMPLFSLSTVVALVFLRELLLLLDSPSRTTARITCHLDHGRAVSVPILTFFATRA